MQVRQPAHHIRQQLKPQLQLGFVMRTIRLQQQCSHRARQPLHHHVVRHLAAVAVDDDAVHRHDVWGGGTLLVAHRLQPCLLLTRLQSLRLNGHRLPM